MGVGLLTAEDVTFALDPGRCLRFSLRSGAPDRSYEVSDRDVATINGRTVLKGTRRYLVAAKSWRPPDRLPPDAAM